MITERYSEEFALPAIRFLEQLGFREFKAAPEKQCRMLQRRISDVKQQFGFDGCTINDGMLHPTVEIYEWEFPSNTGTQPPHTTRGVTLEVAGDTDNAFFKMTASWHDLDTFKRDFQAVERNLILAWGMCQRDEVADLASILLLAPKE